MPFFCTYSVRNLQNQYVAVSYILSLDENIYYFNILHHSRRKHSCPDEIVND